MKKKNLGGRKMSNITKKCFFGKRFQNKIKDASDWTKRSQIKTELTSFTKDLEAYTMEPHDSVCTSESEKLDRECAAKEKQIMNNFERFRKTIQKEVEPNYKSDGIYTLGKDIDFAQIELKDAIHFRSRTNHDEGAMIETAEAMVALGKVMKDMNEVRFKDAPPTGC